MIKKGVLLLNLGTPKSKEVKDVRSYLREFLMDKRVIDIPFVNRWMLVNMIIAPFRAPKSAKEYERVWTNDGSPLLTHGLELKTLVQQTLGDNYVVELGMRYQEPSTIKALESLQKNNAKEITVLPLYPQYASATTGSTIEEVHRLMQSWEIIPSLKVISNFYDHPLFIDAFKQRADAWINQNSYDHFLFSYHGLPERQIHKSSCDNYCQLGACCNKITSKNQYCYRAQCFETTRLITQALEIKEKDYTVCFQSRLGKSEWIKPYTEDMIDKLIDQGVKKVLAFSPAFIADCLETTVEVGETYKEEFINKGGERWDLVESLNTSDLWISCIKDLITNQ